MGTCSTNMAWTRSRTSSFRFGLGILLLSDGVFLQRGGY
jgi:hypothetical protein